MGFMPLSYRRMRAGKSLSRQIAYQDALAGPWLQSRLSLTAMSNAVKATGQVRVGGAVGATLRLLVRRPFSVLAWGLFTTLAGFAPISVIALANIPSAMAAAQAAASAGQLTASSVLLVHMAAALVLAGLVSIVVLAIVDAAVYRAALEPDNRGLFYLKVRRRELEMVGHFLAQIILWAAVIAIAAIPAAWIIGLIANAAGRGLAVLVALIIAIGLGYALAILGLRLFLAGPITFDRAEFGLASSWDVTRDRLGPIFAVAAITIVMLWGWTWLLFAFGHLTLVSAAKEWVSPLPLARRAELVAILTLYLGVARVLVAAPAAIICRQVLATSAGSPTPPSPARHPSIALS
jgi:hypothetical protein